MAKQEFIPASKSDTSNAADIQLAVAALMLEVVKADHRIDRLEVAEMIDTLRDKFQLDAQAVGHLLELAGDVGNYLVHLESLTTRIRDQWDHNQRIQVLMKLWGIAAADQQIDVREVTLIEKMSLLLGIDEASSLQVRHQAEQALNEEL